MGKVGGSLLREFKGVRKERNPTESLSRLGSYRQQTNSILLELLWERLTLFTETADDSNARI